MCSKVMPFELTLCSSFPKDNTTGHVLPLRSICLFKIKTMMKFSIAISFRIPMYQLKINFGRVSKKFSCNVSTIYRVPYGILLTLNPRKKYKKRRNSFMIHWGAYELFRSIQFHFFSNNWIIIILNNERLR